MNDCKKKYENLSDNEKALLKEFGELLIKEIKNQKPAEASYRGIEAKAAYLQGVALGKKMAIRKIDSLFFNDNIWI